ncbi:unnamed protein product [Rhizophagus irregularis]|nr:unnamed protein product [Rhizophagus irregularis]
MKWNYSLGSRPFDKTKKFKETAEESKKMLRLRNGKKGRGGRRQIRIEKIKKTDNCIRLEILEDDEYYDIGTSSIIDLSSEFKGGMYSWFEKDWDNLKKKQYLSDANANSKYLFLC